MRKSGKILFIFTACLFFFLLFSPSLIVTKNIARADCMTSCTNTCHVGATAFCGTIAALYKGQSFPICVWTSAGGDINAPIGFTGNPCTDVTFFDNPLINFAICEVIAWPLCTPFCKTWCTDPPVYCGDGSCNGSENGTPGNENCCAPDCTSSCSVANNKIPVGYVDGGQCLNGYISLWGWAYDPDTSSQSIAVHFYEGSTFVGACTANQYRPDVNAAFGIAGLHGFNCQMNGLSTPGAHTITAYAIDSSMNGANPAIGFKTITCSLPSPAPVTGYCDENGVVSFYWNRPYDSPSFNIRFNDRANDTKPPCLSNVVDGWYCGDAGTKDVIWDGYGWWGGGGAYVTAAGVGQPGKTYDFWYHPCNAMGCDGASNLASVTCPNPTPPCSCTWAAPTCNMPEDAGKTKPATVCVHYPVGCSCSCSATPSDVTCPTINNWIETHPQQ